MSADIKTWQSRMQEQGRSWRHSDDPQSMCKDAEIAELRAALDAARQPVASVSQKPYAYDIRDANGDGCLRLAKDVDVNRLIAVKATPLYTAPAPAAPIDLIGTYLAKLDDKKDESFDSERNIARDVLTGYFNFVSKSGISNSFQVAAPTDLSDEQIKRLAILHNTESSVYADEAIICLDDAGMLKFARALISAAKGAAS